MVRIERIICPIDLDDESLHALEQAVAMARRYRSALSAVHVVPKYVPPTPGITPVLAGPHPSAALINPDTTEPLKRQLEDFAAAARTEGIDARIELLEGDVVEQILGRAAQLEADLVVMGTHGRGGLERLVLGSVTAKVLRRAPCSVMTVAPTVQGPRPSEPTFDRILCAVDFSEPSVGALEYAFSLAQEDRSRVTVLHVLEVPADVAAPANLHVNAGDFGQREQEVLRRLERLWPAGVDDWAQPEARVVAGEAGEVILREAAETKADLIVIGAHGRRLVDLGRFGSTTDHVVRAASCPVLVARGR